MTYFGHRMNSINNLYNVIKRYFFDRPLPFRLLFHKARCYFLLKNQYLLVKYLVIIEVLNFLIFIEYPCYHFSNTYTHAHFLFFFTQK